VRDGGVDLTCAAFDEHPARINQSSGGDGEVVNDRRHPTIDLPNELDHLGLLIAIRASFLHSPIGPARRPPSTGAPPGTRTPNPRIKSRVKDVPGDDDE